MTNVGGSVQDISMTEKCQEFGGFSYPYGGSFQSSVTNRLISKSQHERVENIIVALSYGTSLFEDARSGPGLGPSTTSSEALGPLRPGQCSGLGLRA